MSEYKYENADLNLKFSEMGAPDIAFVSDIERRNYKYPWTRTIFSDCLSSGYLCTVANFNDKIIGYSIVSISKYDAQILNLCVDKDSRRLGFGEKIMDLLIEDIKSRGLNEIYLEVRSSNKQAISLYKKKGFEQIVVRHNYYRDPNGKEDAKVFFLNTKKIGYKQ